MEDEGVSVIMQNNMQHNNMQNNNMQNNNILAGRMLRKTRKCAAANFKMSAAMGSWSRAGICRPLTNNCAQTAGAVGAAGFQREARCCPPTMSAPLSAACCAVAALAQALL